MPIRSSSDSDPALTRDKIIEIVRQATALLGGRIGVCVAAHRIRDLAYAIYREPWDQPDLNAFLVIETQTDHLPVDRGRHHWDPIALQQKDEEIKSVDALYRDRALSAAQQIVEDPRYRL